MLCLCNVVCKAIRVHVHIPQICCIVLAVPLHYVDLFDCVVQSYICQHVYLCIAELHYFVAINSPQAINPPGHQISFSFQP